MRTYRFHIILIFLVASLAPFMAHGQQSIIDAFEALRNFKNAEVEESHFLQRHIDTGVKIGQSDIYEFELPIGKKDLLKKALKAFEQENAQAYNIKSGNNIDSGRNIVLAVGDGKDNNVVLTMDDSRYIYACFLAPKEEDPEGNYRYVYGISYEDFDEDDDEIAIRLVITYAPTLKHRQDNYRLKQLKELQNVESWSSDLASQYYGGVMSMEDFFSQYGNLADTEGEESTSEKENKSKTEPWIRVFIKYVTALGYSNRHTRATNAGYLYEVTSSIDKYKNVTEKDKETAQGILNSLLEDPANNDPVVQQILKSALENLK